MLVVVVPALVLADFSSEACGRFLHAEEDCVQLLTRLVLMVWEQLYEIVTLINELLPPLPDGQGIPLGSSASIGGGGSRGGRKHLGLAIASKTEEGGTGVAGGPSAREILLRDQPELLEQFSNDLFPVLVQVRRLVRAIGVQHCCEV